MAPSSLEAPALLLNTRELKHPDELRTPYGYIPNFGINVTFLVVYVILALASWSTIHLSLNSRITTRWGIRGFFVTVAILFELAGYGARVYSANHPWNFNVYITQFAVLNAAPAFLVIGISSSLHELCRVTSSHENGRRAALKPWPYIALIVLDLATGFLILVGVLASYPEGTVDSLEHTATRVNENAQPMLHLLLGAVAVQIVSLGISLSLLVAAAWRNNNNNNSNPDGVCVSRDFLCCMLIAGVLVMIRAIAKAAEGGAASNEWLYLGLDSILMVGASAAMVVGHPCLSLSEKPLPLPAPLQYESGKEIEQPTPPATRYYSLRNTSDTVDQSRSRP